MKKLEYSFIFYKTHLNDDLAKQDIISSMLEPSTPKGSCWWSGLKSSLHSFKTTADFVANEHLKYFRKEDNECGKGDVFKQSTSKTCPAILNILKNSFLVKAPCDFVITVNKNLEFAYDMTNDWITIDSHAPSQFISEGSDVFKGKMNIKITFPISISTDNVPLIWLQPMYHNNMKPMVINGVIADEHIDLNQLNVNLLVDIPTDEPVSYSFKYGDVLAYIWSPEKLKLAPSKKGKWATVFKRQKINSKTIHRLITHQT